MKDNWIYMLLGLNAYGASPEYETQSLRLCMLLGMVAGFLIGISS